MKLLSKQRKKQTDPIYTDILALERSGLSSIEVAVSLTKSVVNLILSQLKKDYPELSNEEYLNKLRQILFLQKNIRR